MRTFETSSYLFGADNVLIAIPVYMAVCYFSLIFCAKLINIIYLLLFVQKIPLLHLNGGDDVGAYHYIFNQASHTYIFSLTVYTKFLILHFKYYYITSLFCPFSIALST